MGEFERDSFVRQRRNLIGAALTLFFVNTAGVDLKKLNIFGNEIVLQNGHIVPLLFGIAVLYFVWRFFQHSFWAHDTGTMNALFACVNYRLGTSVYWQELRDSGSTIRGLIDSKTAAGRNSFAFHYYPIVGQNAGKAAFAYTNVEGSNRGGYSVDVSSWSITIGWIFGTGDFLIKRKNFSEYILPLLLAAISFLSFVPAFSTFLI